MIVAGWLVGCFVLTSLYLTGMFWIAQQIIKELT